MKSCTRHANPFVEVLALGKSLDIPVLAEGIEIHGQLSPLNTKVCDEAQGYYLGRPAPLEQIVTSGQITLAGPQLLKDTLVRAWSQDLAFDLAGTVRHLTVPLRAATNT
jgi:predicted signal transduction protein with EAL and GGDEF domain